MQRPIEERYHARRMVEKLLLHPSWKRKSTNAVAKELRVSWSYVDQIRSKLDPNIPKHREDTRGVLRPATRESKFGA